MVIVGYSFRDKYIKLMMWESANRNEDLAFIFIDPKSPEIYEEKLAYYDSAKHIPSSLKDRVLLMPYQFENALPLLKNSFINILKDAKTEEKTHRGIENW